MTEPGKPTAPLILFVYNRPRHTRQTLDSLRQCTWAAQSHLYVFSDGPKNTADQPAVAEVRGIVRDLPGFRSVTVVEKIENHGLARSVIAGVTEIMQKHGRAIVLEDDLVFADDFLVFMNESLHVYQHQESIFSISGYSYPIQIPADYKHDVYVLPRASSWGWATWADRWAKADWGMGDYQDFIRDKAARKAFAQGGEDLVYMLIKQNRGVIDSWAVRWSYTHFKHNSYCLFPCRSKVSNTGNDRSGTHSPHTRRFDSVLQGGPVVFPDVPPGPDNALVSGLQHFFSSSLYRKAVNWLRYSPQKPGWR